jgi:hypothetical protein
VYVQKSNNVQVWNEDVAPARRYVLVRVSPDDVINRVKVVTGDQLAALDTTGTLTQKYQARLVLGQATAELVTSEDTGSLAVACGRPSAAELAAFSPSDDPTPGLVLPIRTVFGLLQGLLGTAFMDSGYDQERNRGAELHRRVCRTLGYSDYRDDGRFPDVRHQLVEVKLQTSPTIDLGLVRPDSDQLLDVPKLCGRSVRHCDVRYAVFYARTDGQRVELTHLYVTTGETFFGRFEQFRGRVVNRKLQIHLPNTFFDE